MGYFLHLNHFKALAAMKELNESLYHWPNPNKTKMNI